MLMLQTKTFIERNRETEIFVDWLQKADAMQRPRIFFLYSKPELEKKAGLGKTMLLRRFFEIASKQAEHTVVMVDFLNVHDRSGETIAERVVEALRSKYPDWNSTSFTYALSEYKESLREDGRKGGPPKDGEDLRRNLRLALHQCLQLLKADFAETKGRIILFFDTFETIGQDFSSVMLQNNLPFPDTYDFPYIDFVIAGREAPDRADLNWSENWKAIQLLPVQPFTRDEMLQYYQLQLSSQEYEQVSTHIERVRELTQGRPILISLIADLFTTAKIFSDEFSFDDLLTANLEDFEERLVRSISNPTITKNLVVLAMAHVHHRFNHRLFLLIFDALPPGDKVMGGRAGVWSQLLEFSFVRKASNSNDITLHDEMRELVNKYNWPDERFATSLRHDLSLRVVRYYQQEIEDNQDQPTIYQSYVIEQLYHKFFVDHEDGWQAFTTLFDEAIQKWQLGYARNLLREVRRPEIQALLSIEQKADLEIDEVVLLRKEERAQEALERCVQFKEGVSETWLNGHSEKLLFELGECYRAVYDFDEALVYFHRIVRLASFRTEESSYFPAEALSRIGSIYEQRADFDNATRCYEESLQLFKQKKRRSRYIDALNHLCQVHCDEGNFNAALRNCLVALSICRETREISPAMRVDSLSTAGMVYTYRRDFATALQYITEAQDEAERLRHKQRIARIYTIRGDLELAKENYAGARLWFEKSYHTSLLVNKEMEIRSLYKQAIADVYLQKWEAAEESLKKVRDRAVEMNNQYWEVKAQLLQIDVLHDRGRDLDAERLYQEVLSQIKPLKSYYRLFGDAERKLALTYYSELKYVEAFEHFGRFCEYLAQCTLKELVASVNETATYLLELRSAEIPALFDLFKRKYKKSIERHIGQTDRQAVVQILQELQDIVDFYRENPSPEDLEQSDSNDDPLEGTSNVG
jgi:tetratricopeptide (TPR) repeat protein